MPLHGFCDSLRPMETNDSTTTTLEVIRLLDGIVRAFADGDSRPADQIALYEKYLELQKMHRVKLRGRFILIAGGGAARGVEALARVRRKGRMVAARQRFAAQGESPDSLPNSA
jgi:hypothetical protein